VRRSGFSLIELLIVVAIIAALVGVAVPMFQKNISEAKVAKCKQDLDTLRNAITLHDSQNRPLIGTSLKPLLGRYLQELPKDPWGNEYLLDAGVGLIVSFGGNQAAGGFEEDGDLPVRYKASLKIQSVNLTGPAGWGQPKKGHQLRIQFNKPFQFSATEMAKEPLPPADSPPTEVADQFRIIVKASAGTADPNKTMAAFPGSWKTTKCHRTEGWLILEATADSSTTTDAITPSCAMNMSTTDAVKNLYELYTPGGPLDAKLWGSGVDTVKTAQGIEWIGNENRGVPIQRAN
jgi:general secretion pathway protein G